MLYWQMRIFSTDSRSCPCISAITKCQLYFEETIITKVLLFNQLKLNTEKQQNYYLKHKEGVFSERYISPTL